MVRAFCSLPRASLQYTTESILFSGMEQDLEADPLLPSAPPLSLARLYLHCRTSTDPAFLKEDFAPVYWLQARLFFYLSCSRRQRIKITVRIFSNMCVFFFKYFSGEPENHGISIELVWCVFVCFPSILPQNIQYF